MNGIIFNYRQNNFTDNWSMKQMDEGKKEEVQSLDEVESNIYNIVIEILPKDLLKVLPRTLLIFTKRTDVDLKSLSTSNGTIELVIEASFSSLIRITNLIQKIIEVENVIFENEPFINHFGNNLKMR